MNTTLLTIMLWPRLKGYNKFSFTGLELIAFVRNMKKCMGQLHNIIFSVKSEISLEMHANERSVLLSANKNATVSTENAHDPLIPQSASF